MPNHITTIIKTDEPTMTSIKELMGNDVFDFDFQKIIPMPRHIFRGDLSQADEEKHGAINCRHKWSINNRGTKWNAYTIEYGTDQVKFQTAWGHPFPIIRELSMIYPDAEFSVEYADESIGQNFGSYVIKKLERSDIDIEDGKAFGFRVNGYTEEDIKEFESGE